MSEKVVTLRPRIKETEEEERRKNEEPVIFTLELGNNTCLSGTTQVVYNKDNTVSFFISIDTESGQLEPIVSLSVLNDRLVTTTHATINGEPQPMAIVQHLFTNIKPVKYKRHPPTPRLRPQPDTKVTK